jgi:hypothetical protein
MAPTTATAVLTVNPRLLLPASMLPPRPEGWNPLRVKQLKLATMDDDETGRIGGYKSVEEALRAADALRANGEEENVAEAELAAASSSSSSSSSFSCSHTPAPSPTASEAAEAAYEAAAAKRSKKFADLLWETWQKKLGTLPDDWGSDKINWYLRRETMEYHRVCGKGD